MDKRDYWTKCAEENIINSEETEQKTVKKIIKLWEDVGEEVEKELIKFYYKHLKNDKLKLEELYEILTKDENVDFNKKARKFYNEAKEKFWKESYQKEVLNA